MKTPYHSPSYIQSWQRTSPIYEHLTRLTRLTYSLILFLPQLPLIALDSLLHKTHYGRPSWSLPQRCLRLLISYAIWSFNPGTRPARDVLSDSARRRIPKLARGNHAELVVVPAVEEGELCGDAVNEDVKPEECPCFWQWTDDIPSPSPSPSPTSLSNTDTSPVDMEKKKVIMYFVGGGMVQGHPLALAFPFTISSQTHIPIFSPNFRKCVTAATAFPAALQDAISAFTYLLSLGYLPSNISVMGDSGGGCIAITLVLYLLRHKLPVPGAMILSSPFVDLVDDFLSEEEGERERLRLDVVNPEMMSMVGYQYTENRPELRGTLLSPARGELPEGYSWKGWPRLFVVWGEVEVFRGGIRRWLDEVRKDNEGGEVEGVEMRDCVHDYWMFSGDMSREGPWGKLRAFMGVSGDEGEGGKDS